jgi:hypothetical protein
MAALIRIFGIAIPLLAGAASACAFAAERASVVPPIGERASYLWTTSLRTPAGTHNSSAAVVLRGAPRGTMQIAVTVDGDDLDFLAKTLADGSLDFVATKHEDAVPELGRLDQISRLVAGAGVPPKAGDSWKLTLSEPVPGGTIEVPVVVRVVAGDDNTLNLEAEGDGRGSIELPKPPLDPAGRRGGGTPGFPGGGGGGGAPAGITGSIDDGSEQSKATTMDVKLHLHLSARFAGGFLVEARGAQVASPESGPKESIETDWELTKS